MTRIVRGFFFSPDEAHTWATRHAPDEISLEGACHLSTNIYRYFWRKGINLQAITVFDREGLRKILIVTDSIEVSAEEAMNYPAFKLQV